MADRIDTAMDPVQAPRLETAGSSLPIDSGVFQLPQRDHAVLSGRYPADPAVRIGFGAFFTHVREESAKRPILAPLPSRF